MARMLSDRDSTARHLDATRRHTRLCQQVKGADQIAAAIQPTYQDLLQKQADTAAKFEAQQNALDDFILRDLELDDGVRTAFEKCKQFDRDNPGAQVLLKVFPDGRFHDLTKVERTQEPDAVEQLALRFESLGTEHALYSAAAQLRAQIDASRAALAAYHQAIRTLKLAEAEEEIAQAVLRRQYEINYLDARKLLGRDTAERLFPRIAARDLPAPPADAEPESV